MKLLLRPNGDDMNRFNLDPVFTLTLRRVDKGYVSNLVNVQSNGDSFDHVEEELSTMKDFPQAALILSKFTQKSR